jgi:hypothetical protein
MKKVFSIFTLAMLLMAFSACNDDNNDSNIQKMTGEILSNSVDIDDGQSVYVAISGLSLEWNVTNSTISLNYNVAVTASSTAAVSLQDVALTPNTDLACYTFSTPNGGNGITNLNGYFRPETGCLYIDFLVNGTHRVMSATQFYYPYLKYNFTDSETNTSKESPNGAMLIIINPKDMSAQLLVGNFALTETGGVIQQAAFYGMNVEATTAGYKVTYTGDQRSTDGSYTLNSFDCNITGSGKIVNGTITINERYNGTFAGSAFAN